MSLLEEIVAGVIIGVLIIIARLLDRILKLLEEKEWLKTR